MNIRAWAIGLAVAGAVGGVAGYLHERDDRVRKEAMAEVAQARLDSLMEVVRTDSIAQAREDSAAAVTIARADSARALAETRAAQAAQAADRAREDRDSLEAAVMQATDSTATREALEDLRASHERETSALREHVSSLGAGLAAADSVIASQADQIVARDRTIVGLREALAASNAAVGIDTSESWVETWGERLAWTAGGAGVGWLVARGMD